VTLTFYFLSFVAILFALMVVFAKNPVHCVLYLIMTFFAIAGHYALLGAQFLFAVHIIVYAGAIMVLFLYVIMLLNLNKESEPHKSNILKITATVCGGLLLLIVVGSLRGAESMPPPNATAENISLVKNLGKVMFTEFLIPLEVTSLLLLAAMVGAVMLGKSEPSKREQ
jgi:NADH-quinone oxidoreductase subunit J